MSGAHRRAPMVVLLFGALLRFHNISCGGAAYQNHNGNGRADKSTVTHTSINRLRMIGISLVRFVNASHK